MIHSDMEESMPTLASWIQMGCNSSNSIGRPQSELELATTISKFFEGGLDLQQAIQRAKQGDIKCQGSLPSVALYVQRFSGGANFPLLAWLTKFSQQYGSTLLLGAEFAHALANLDFKVPGQLFPMIRLAAWATQLTSTHRSADGYARMLSKSDLERMKNNLTIDKTKEAESILLNAWETMQELVAASPSQENHYHRCYGKLAVRTILFITGKQKMSREKMPWKDLASILKIFSEEAKATPAQVLQEAEESSSSQKEPMKVEVVLSASPKALAMLQNPHLKQNGMHHSLTKVCVYLFSFLHWHV